METIVDATTGNVLPAQPNRSINGLTRIQPATRYANAAIQPLQDQLAGGMRRRDDGNALIYPKLEWRGDLSLSLSTFTNVAADTVTAPGAGLPATVVLSNGGIDVAFSAVKQDLSRLGTTGVYVIPEQTGAYFDAVGGLWNFISKSTNAGGTQQANLYGLVQGNPVPNFSALNSNFFVNLEQYYNLAELYSMNIQGVRIIFDSAATLTATTIARTSTSKRSLAGFETIQRETVSMYQDPSNNLTNVVDIPGSIFTNNEIILLENIPAAGTMSILFKLAA